MEKVSFFDVMNLRFVCNKGSTVKFGVPYPPRAQKRYVIAKVRYIQGAPHAHTPTHGTLYKSSTAYNP